MDAPECAVIGVPGKARQRGGLLPTRRSNAAWRVKRGAIGCIALITGKNNVIEAEKVNAHAVVLKFASGQLPFPG